MAGKADFTDEEWDALQKGVTGSGMLVSVSHRDFTDSFGEAKAIAEHLAAHRNSESQLVRELSGTHGTGFGLVASPKEVTEGTMAALGTAVTLLGEKAPDELGPIGRSCSPSRTPSPKPREASPRRRPQRSNRSQQRLAPPERGSGHCCWPEQS